MTAVKRNKKHVLSYMLAAVLVVLTAPTLVVLSFTSSLPDSHIGFKTRLLRRGHDGGSAEDGSALRAGSSKHGAVQQFQSDTSELGTARRALIHKSSDAATLAARKAKQDAQLDTAASEHAAKHGAATAAKHAAHSHEQDLQQQQEEQQWHDGQAADQANAQQGGTLHQHQEQEQEREQGRGELQHAHGSSALHADGLKRQVGGQQQAVQRSSTQQQRQQAAGGATSDTQQLGQQQGHLQQQQQQRQRRSGGKQARPDTSGLPKPLRGNWSNLLPQGKGPLLPRPGCTDVQPVMQCRKWAESGGCDKNPGYMYRNCAASCGLCMQRYLHGAEVPQQVEVVPGVVMPTVGYGTAGLGDLTADAVFTAIRVGYRLVDSAGAREWYREDLVGWGWSASGIKREHLFVTSKVHPRRLGYWSTLDAFNEALQELQTSYVDLMLLHYPECWGGLCGDAKVEGTWQDSWSALEQLVHEGKLRAAGVSNFNLDQLAELVGITTIKPALLQANSDVLNQNVELQAYCRLHGIQFQAYSSLGGQWLAQAQEGNPVLDHPVVAEIAARLGRTPAQVVLRWALQHGQAVLPRTSKVNRMEQNLDLFSFDLTDADMQRLDALDGTMQLATAEQTR